APENWIGIACIMVGVVFIERSLSKPQSGPKGISRRGLVFPLIAALTVAFSVLARKHGLNIYNEPLLGVAIGYSSSFLLYLLLSIYSHAKLGYTLSGKDFRLFWKAGVGLSLAWVLSFYALSHERVSIVAPLMQTEPLFVLFFVYIYLRKLESISFKLVISTLLIVIGVMLVSIR
ncbi:EamA family transporter, partial [Candidatus Bathyarchaeota archaeon]|nr:EamA family transporter [Candidatus Bathyarchaeota archaeon]